MVGKKVCVMEKLSSKVLSVEEWNEAKEQLKFFWLKKKEQPCCYYYNPIKDYAFLICYDLKDDSLNYHTWKNPDDRSLFAKVVTYIPEIKNEDVEELICPNCLINKIDEFYMHEKR